MGGNEINYVNNAFETNWIAPLGPHVVGFEQDIKTFLGTSKEVAALSSGTAAIHLALVMLGVSHGDEVICQSMTFSASANPILYQGAIPVFVDSEPNTWNICPEETLRAIESGIKRNKKPKAIIAVHLYGVPFQVERLREISKHYDIPIIEDSAEALGSTYNGEHCGTFGDFGVLSFNGNKIITTSGGGALVCPDLKAKEKVVFYATQSRDPEPHYQHSHVGYNYRLSNVCAGIGRGQMEVLDDRVKARRAMHQFYMELFENIPGVEVFSADESIAVPNYWLTSILVDPSETGGKSREELRIYLENFQVESRPLWKPMHLQPIFENYSFFGSGISDKLFANGLCLPSGSNLTEVEKNRIAEAVKTFFAN
jgi:dTDP-4-amino-4,6-dideoxygalactose transaminase